jgi:hypothetical protein
MSIKQLFESGGSVDDIPKLTDPNYNPVRETKVDWSLNPTGDGDPDPLTPQKRQEWNQYVDYVEKRGYKGSTELDKRDTGLANKLFEEFRKENPTATISLNDIQSVQYEMQQLKKTVTDFAKRKGVKDADNMMHGISKVDGWPGSKTTQFKFPIMAVDSFHNGQFMGRRDLGLVDSKLNPSQVHEVKPSVPKGAKLEKMSDGKTYYENEQGEMIPYE